MQLVLAFNITSDIAGALQSLRGNRSGKAAVLDRLLPGSNVRSLSVGHPLQSQQQLVPALPPSTTPSSDTPHSPMLVPQLSARFSHAASGSHRSRQHPADDAENQWLGSLDTPQSLPFKDKSAQRRRPKPRRPQWQDVSIDVSALQSSQADASPSLQHSDRPVGSMSQTDTPNAVHMSGVSPASPSPPKHLALHAPHQQHKAHVCVQAPPVLSPRNDASNTPQALSAWHQNLEQAQQRQHQQHRLSHEHVQGGRPSSLDRPLHHVSQHAEQPRCLPPLHHQPPFLQQAQHATEAGPQSPHQSPSEDPRSAQQVPLQYMRHPCGSGSPGGLHKLHRLLKAISRARPEPIDSALAAPSLTHRDSVLLHGGHQEDHPPPTRFRGSGSMQAAPMSLRHLQPLDHSRDVAAKQQQLQQERSELIHQQCEPESSLMPHTQWQQKQEPGSGQLAYSHATVSTAQDESSSRHPSAAIPDDLQDVNVRLQQVCTQP